MRSPRPGKRVRLIIRWGVLSLAALLLLTAAVVLGTRRERAEVAAAGADVEGLTSVLSQTVDASRVPIRFTDVTAETGLRFRHMPFSRESLLPEDMGSGIACGDYDGDGYPDLFVVNFASSVKPGAKVDREAGRCRLFRNVAGQRFEDVTSTCGIDLVCHGMGAAWGDYDNDGALDLYVTAYGENVLYRNQGDGTFTEVTARAGVGDSRFSAGCSWGDYDRDGFLDLYVCNYVDFKYEKGMRGKVERQYQTEQPYTLNPSSYPAQLNALFRNRGDGTFADVGARAGVANPESRSLSVSWVDLDNDGWSDLYVANDVSKNGVYRNRGDGTFEDIGASSLAADYRGAMGIAVADFDDDRDQDLLITHWIAQENAFYLNMKINRQGTNQVELQKAWFVDAADQFGLGQASLDSIGWATGFCDFDNDGLRDLWVINGSTFEDPADHRQLKPQLPFVFWHQGEQGYIDVAAHASPALAAPFVGRGGVQLDYDRDGRMDLVILQLGGPVAIFKNTSPSPGHWLQVKLRQKGGNTQALGARVYVTTGDRTQMAEVGCSSSYLSQDESKLHFGLGEAVTVDSVRVVWPDGREEVHRDEAVDQEMILEHQASYTGK